jgi:predicted amidohydrolase
MKLGVYQNHPEFGQTDKNTQQAIEEINRIEADLMVLPELFNTGYQFISKEEILGLAEEIPSGKTCQALMELAAAKNMYLVFGLAERARSRIFNSAVIVGPKGYIGRYRKAHLFLEETFYFEPGDTGFRVFDIGPAKIGMMICFDWWFPESARVLALKGADIICHPANLVLPSCQQAMAIRSLENGVFSATANRIGTEARRGKEPLVFTGESQVLDHRGDVLTCLEKNKTGICVAEINVKKARDKSITPLNDRFQDRRPELYKQLLNRD